MIIFDRYISKIGSNVEYSSFRKYGENACCPLDITVIRKFYYEWKWLPRCTKLSANAISLAIDYSIERNKNGEDTVGSLFFSDTSEVYLKNRVYKVQLSLDIIFSTFLALSNSVERNMLWIFSSNNTRMKIPFHLR